MTDRNKVYKYKFYFRYGDKIVEKEQVTYRSPEESFERACALLDFTDCDEVRMFEFDYQYNTWYERIDLY